MLEIGHAGQKTSAAVLGVLTALLYQDLTLAGTVADQACDGVPALSAEDGF